MESSAVRQIGASAPKAGGGWQAVASQLTWIVPLQIHSTDDPRLARLRYLHLDRSVRRLGVEVWVVDQSAAAWQNTVAEHCAQLGYRYLRCGKAGGVFSIAAVRNLAAERASSEYIAFFDVDLLPYDGYVADVCKEVRSQGLQRYADLLVMTPVIYLTELGTEHYWQTPEAERKSRFVQYLLDEERRYIEKFSTGTSVCVYNRLWYLACGGNSTDFEGWGGEDLEFNNRLLELQGRFADPEDKPRDYKTFKNVDEYVGWKSRYRLLGDISLLKGLYVFHAWHPVALSSHYHQRRQHNLDLVSRRLHRPEPRRALLPARARTWVLGAAHSWPAYAQLALHGICSQPEITSPEQARAQGLPSDIRQILLAEACYRLDPVAWQTFAAEVEVQLAIFSAEQTPGATPMWRVDGTSHKVQQAWQIQAGSAEQAQYWYAGEPLASSEPAEGGQPCWSVRLSASLLEQLGRERLVAIERWFKNLYQRLPESWGLEVDVEGWYGFYAGVPEQNPRICQRQVLAPRGQTALESETIGSGQERRQETVWMLERYRAEWQNACPGTWRYRRSECQLMAFESPFEQAPAAFERYQLRNAPLTPQSILFDRYRKRLQARTSAAPAGRLVQRWPAQGCALLQGRACTDLDIRLLRGFHSPERAASQSLSASVWAAQADSVLTLLPKSLNPEQRWGQRVRLCLHLRVADPEHPPTFYHGGEALPIAHAHQQGDRLRVFLSVVLGLPLYCHYPHWRSAAVAQDQRQLYWRLEALRQQ